MRKEDNSSNIESPIVSLKGPKIKAGCDLSLGFGPLIGKTKANIETFNKSSY